MSFRRDITGEVIHGFRMLRPVEKTEGNGSNTGMWMWEGECLECGFKKVFLPSPYRHRRTDLPSTDGRTKIRCQRCRKKYDDQRRREAKTLRAGGMTYAKIAEIMSISLPRAYQLVADTG